MVAHQAVVLAIGTAVACGSSTYSHPPNLPPATDFPAIKADFYAAYLRAHPGTASWLGLHDYDGRLPDVSAQAIQARAAALKRTRDDLQAVKPHTLGKLERVERAVILLEIRSELFKLETLRQPQRNPLYYGGSLGVSRYVTRDYAPLSQRAQAIVATAQAMPGFLAHARENLSAALPKPWVETALLQINGHIKFVTTDVRTALAPLRATPDWSHIDAALSQLIAAYEQHQRFLNQKLTTANQNYALGRDTFYAMLAQTQGVRISPHKLAHIANADLERNWQAIVLAAQKIDPNKTTTEVVAQVLADKPDSDRVIAEATEQAGRMRAFLLQNNIVSIPSEDVAIVKETPPFMRWNFAFLDGAGPFETKPLPSFYYITPPNPAWPQEQQREYIPGKTDLLATTIHELWPGHFLHSLHSKRIQSKILKSFWNYATGEGWAHYTEEMMWNQGIEDRDPRVHIGQLIAALLRNVRFVSAIGLHTNGMTIDESERLFRDKAFQDPANARQQAIRGTRDPMYLSYTLGKLMIKKLRKDWKAAQGAAYSLRAFHDTFLSYGAAPIPVIRNAMLGAQAGPVL